MEQHGESGCLVVLDLIYKSVKVSCFSCCKINFKSVGIASNTSNKVYRAIF